MSKLFDLLYIIITNLYNSIFTFFELFKKKKINSVNQNNEFLKNGFCKIKIQEPLANYFAFEKIQQINKYMDKFILSDEHISRIIKYLFLDLKLSKTISDLTGFNYSIDYFIAYRTHPISHEDINKGWYANHWHKDKPFTKNTLKIIIPLKNIENINHGGMEILTIENSKIFQKTKTDVESYKMIANLDEVLLFNPNLCLHKAGEIKGNYIREQIMFQLNPNINWCYNKNIKTKQFKIEPKFPFFSYFFDKKFFLMIN